MSLSPLSRPVGALPLMAGGVTNAAPLFDFPGITAGRQFTLAVGSKVGLLSPKGTASVDRMDATIATFHMQATAVGQVAKFEMTIERIDAGHVRITSKNLATGASQMVLATVLGSRQNFAQFQNSDGSGTTTVQQDAPGHVVIDTAIPGYGKAHLILQ